MTSAVSESMAAPSISFFDDLISRVQRRTGKTVVIGLGYVGLPLALQHARAGFKVTGIEINPDRVAQVNRGSSYIGEVTDDELNSVARTGHFCATSEFSGISEADVVAICVPTPLDSTKRPDTSHIEYVMQQAKPYWHAGQLVILESTTYPGTTEEVIKPCLEAQRLKVGTDIFLAYSPERIDPGNRHFQIGDIARVVGGITPSCAEVARLFYQQLMKAPVISVSSPKVAEMTKLFENVFRVVNVSLVNELAQLCERMGIDVWEVIEAAKTKPYGFMPFYPGPGVGGHCIPVDPFYLSSKAHEYGFTTRFIELAGEINDNMPGYVVAKIADVLNKHRKPVNGSKILICGLTFKKDVADTREAGPLKIALGLLDQGAILSYHDPLIPSIAINGLEYESVPLTSEVLRGCELVVIGSDHSSIDYGLIAKSSRLVFDTRNALRDFPASHIYRLGAPEPE